MNAPAMMTEVSEALRKITEARQILEQVVISSENFDYRRAKEGIKGLQRMIRELGREEARLRAGMIEESAQVLPFPREHAGPQKEA